VLRRARPHSAYISVYGMHVHTVSLALAALQIMALATALCDCLHACTTATTACSAVHCNEHCVQAGNRYWSKPHSRVVWHWVYHAALAVYVIDQVFQLLMPSRSVRLGWFMRITLHCLSRDATLTVFRLLLGRVIPRAKDVWILNAIFLCFCGESPTVQRVTRH
jgi:hypothetical protein